MTLEQIIQLWNEQSDEYNQWIELSCNEKVQWVYDYFKSRLSEIAEILEADIPQKDLTTSEGIIAQRDEVIRRINKMYTLARGGGIND
jgi:hypothetical protein